MESKTEVPHHSKDTHVEGIKIDSEGFELDHLLSGLSSMGGQATNVGLARELFAELISLRKQEVEGKKPIVFLGYTSNMISCGLREIFKVLCQYKLVDAIVTTTGGIEEDFMKCTSNFYVNYEFVVDDKQWRKDGVNRTGNIAVPNDNYTAFEDWLVKQINLMVLEQENNGTIYSPSEFIRFLGERINNEDSVYHWCAKNDIEVFCPGLTDGSLGDNLYVNGFTETPLIVDVNKDIQKIMSLGLDKDRPLAAFIIGGGVVKYHILNACKVAGGLDMGIFVCVGSELDNTYSGAKPEQEMTRNAIKPNAKVVNVSFEASIAVPLITANQLEGLV